MKKRTTGPLTVKSALFTCGLGVATGVAFVLFGWLYIPGIGLAMSIVTAALALAAAAVAFDKPSLVTSALLASAVAIGGWIAIRSAEFLVAFNVMAVLALLLLALWTLAYEPVPWRLRLRAAVFGFGDTIYEAMAGAATPIGTLLDRRGHGKLGSAAPYVRGALIAVPLVIVFGALFSSADAVFSDMLGDAIPSVDIGDTLADVLWAVFFSWVAIGLFVLALQPDRRGETKVRRPGAWVAAPRPDANHERFIEVAVVLGALALLFALFVIVQFAYLFGGNEQIAVPGVTYSEYAREGFFQLVAVTALTVAVIAVSMRVVGRVGDSRRDVIFKTLCWILVALTFVILASALKRIGLYEDAYGLTRARMTSHAFAIWLGAVLVLVAVQVQRRRPGLVAGGSIALAVIALFAFNAINPDARIAAHNIERAESRGGSTADEDATDLEYITELSPDAMPVVFDRIDLAELEEGERIMIEFWLCETFDQPRSWQEWSRGYTKGEQSADAAAPPPKRACA